jgi:hypothetical protein
LQEWNFRIILKKHIICLLNYQNKYWKKRCTYRWAQVGDEKTKYFHARALERYRHNSIVSLTLDDGRTVDSHDEKVAAFLSSFKQRMGISHSLDIFFNLEELFQRIDGLQEISCPFSKDEIDKIIKSLPTDKSPGPDGFNGMFVKVCWEIVALDFYKPCEDLWEGNISLNCLNGSLITLVPKKTRS